MTTQEKKDLDFLLSIREEDDPPFTSWEIQFLESLDANRELALTEKQAAKFDMLVEKHL